MRTLKRIVLSGFFMLIVSNACLAGEEAPRVGVLKFRVAEGLNPGLGDFLSDTFLEQMVATGKFTVIDWQAVDREMKEARKAKPDISENDAITQAMKRLTIHRIYAGSLTRVGEKYLISIKILTPNAEVERVEKASAPNEDGLEGSMDGLTSALLLTPEEREVKEEKALAKLQYGPDKGNEVDRDGRFVAYSNGVVVDTESGLMWAAKDNGSDTTWTYADNYCDDFEGAGYKDWRMPTIEELKGLYDKTQKNRSGYRLTRLIDLTQCCAWSSDTRGTKALSLRFLNGNQYWTEQENNNFRRILPVRSGN
jgi:hypothetical protein